MMRSIICIYFYSSHEYLCNDGDVISGLIRRHFDETARSKAVGHEVDFTDLNFRITLNTQQSATSFCDVDAHWTGSVTPIVKLVDSVLLLGGYVRLVLLAWLLATVSVSFCCHAPRRTELNSRCSPELTSSFPPFL